MEGGVQGEESAVGTGTRRSGGMRNTGECTLSTAAAQQPDRFHGEPSPVLLEHVFNRGQKLGL